MCCRNMGLALLRLFRQMRSRFSYLGNILKKLFSHTSLNFICQFNKLLSAHVFGIFHFIADKVKPLYKVYGSYGKRMEIRRNEQNWTNNFRTGKMVNIVEFE